MEEGIIEEAMISAQDFWKIQGKEVNAPPHCFIGAIQFQTDKGQKGVGSVALISLNIVITAAHVIFNRLYQKFNKNFRVYFSANGIGEKYYEVQSFKIHEDFKSSRQKSRIKHDYGILKLKQSIKFDKYLKLAFPCQTCFITNKEIQLSIYGYPKEYKDNWKTLDKKGQKKVLFQYGLTRKDRYQMMNTQKGQIGYKINTLGGHSGSPVIIGNDTIIAIHSAFQQEKGYNIGRIICSELIKIVTAWIKQVKGSPFCFEQSRCNHSKISMQKTESQKSKFVVQEEKHQIQKQKNAVIKSCFPQLNYEDRQKKHPQIETTASEQQQLIIINDEIKLFDLSNRSNLTNLTLRFCQLESINLNVCPLLIKINLQGNRLESVNLESNLDITHLDLKKNHLTNINLISNTKLLYVDLSINFLSKLDLSKNKILKRLKLWSNPLKEIDVSLNIELQQLRISKANIPQINLKKNQKLMHLDIETCHLKEIDLSKNTNLKTLKLHDNILKEIVLLKNTKLEKLKLNSNKLTIVSVFYSDYMWSNYKDFDFFDQRTKQCKIIIKVEKQEYKQKANEVASQWTQQLKQQKCTYFIVLEK